MKYDKQDRQGKAAFNERSPHPTQQSKKSFEKQTTPHTSHLYCCPLPSLLNSLRLFKYSCPSSVILASLYVIFFSLSCLSSSVIIRLGTRLIGPRLLSF
jgi:hypothetical protein